MSVPFPFTEKTNVNFNYYCERRRSLEREDEGYNFFFVALISELKREDIPTPSFLSINRELEVMMTQRKQNVDWQC